jgi:molecular chaperone HtpG
MQKGNINVSTENIFPIIKKFLYSDHEIFLRELVANAVDATQKLRTISSAGDFKGDIGEVNIEVKIDKEAKTLTVSDRGIGMTAEEVEKFINQIAFSSAEDFVNKYKSVTDANPIIGHFGLGFYSAFMVASKVEIFTKTYKKGPNTKAAHWTCDGSPEYTIEENDKKERGTDVVLHIAEDSEEFLDDARIQGILTKYCKFLPVEIVFGTKKEPRKNDKDEFERDADGKMIYDEQPRIINNTKPAWTAKPSDLKPEDYLSFYHELYPMAEEPLFHIHLNVDYPFNLTGILYFPKVKRQMELQKDKIQLYCNQVFVTDSVEGIVPDFLTLLHGVLDSPDIPLNVSRSYLQSDSNVKKISSHIMKKVADKLEEIARDQREEFESKWDDIKVFIQYGMITEEKFYERAMKFMLMKNTEAQYFGWEDYQKHIEEKQKDKNGKLVCLYTNDTNEQFTYIESARSKGYDVLLMDSTLDSHFINHFERKLENISFARVDADTIDKLIEKDTTKESALTAQQKDLIRPVFQGQLDNKYTVVVEDLDASDMPVIITRPEFMRRMRDMEKLGGRSGFEMPEYYNVVINANHPTVTKLTATVEEKAGKETITLDEEITKLQDTIDGYRKDEKLREQHKEDINLLEKEKNEKEEKRNQLLKSCGQDITAVHQMIDLALLSQNMLTGEALSRFIRRSYEII